MSKTKLMLSVILCCAFPLIILWGSFYIVRSVDLYRQWYCIPYVMTVMIFLFLSICLAFASIDEFINQ